MTEYLKKSDVMAVMAWNHYAQQILNGLPTITVADKGDKGEPVKLKGGKLYRTRDGRKAFVAVVVNNPPFKSAYGCMEESTSTSSWYLDGRFVDKGESRHDLISLWDEPAEHSLSEMVENIPCLTGQREFFRRIVRELESKP